MEFSDVVRRRRMVRRYDPDRPVPLEIVERCLANAVRAPSAGFSQGWDFVVLSKDDETRSGGPRRLGTVRATAGSAAYEMHPC